MKLKYGLEFLQEYCVKNNIELIKDYSNINVNRRCYIEGKCKNFEICKNNFNKDLKQLIKTGNTCQSCNTKNIAKITRERCLLFTYDLLFNYCKENDLILLEDYTNSNLNIDYYIQGKCKTEGCKNDFRKPFRRLIELGGFCKNCSKELGKEKIIQTTLNKYNTINVMQNDIVKQKLSDSVKEKYGVNCYFQTEEFKNKVIQTNLERYGVNHHSQNAEVAETMLTKAYKLKQYKLPSGNIIDYQGYKNFALDTLLLIEKINEDDIINSRKNVPEIWYNDKNGKRRRHYVDFYIKSQNRCIEVKSTWTNQEKNNVFEKQKAAKDLGYKYEIWIYDKNGNILETL
jgi:hypothetical protein